MCVDCVMRNRKESRWVVRLHAPDEYLYTRNRKLVDLIHELGFENAHVIKVESFALGGIKQASAQDFLPQMFDQRTDDIVVGRGSWVVDPMFNDGVDAHTAASKLHIAGRCISICLIYDACSYSKH